MTADEHKAARRHALERAFKDRELRLAFFELVEGLGYRGIGNVADPQMMAFHQGRRAGAKALLELIATADPILPSRMALEYDQFQQDYKQSSPEPQENDDG